jgi:phytoene dehydrogenase-like protein
MIINEQHFDAIVIGAGLGGLLSAAQLAKRGQRVVVVERLAHVGGRFTAKTFQGAQVSTGAVHMLPFGSNGVLAAMLRELRVPHGVRDAEVFGSFLVGGRQIRVRSILSVARVLGLREYARFVQLGAQMFLRQPRLSERSATFADWLAVQGVTRATFPLTVAFFERICHFALSVDLDQVLYPEIGETTKNMFRYGPPGIVDGGCAAVANALEQRLLASGVTLLLHHDVCAIGTSEGAVSGVTALDRTSGSEIVLRAPLVVSGIDPHVTLALARGDGSASEPAGPRVATGLKTHVLSQRSLIGHKGIMYCLDTGRIAGVVQPSNSDRRLAPPGEHLIITHQLWRPERESVADARALALADLERILGPRGEGSWRVLTMSQYHDAWPVNRAVQGEDIPPVTDLRGLYLVGDAVKPSGYLMVEGVAQSVNALLDAVDHDSLPAGEHPSHIAPKPPRRRALAWLIAPPAPYRSPVAGG